MTQEKALEEFKFLYPAKASGLTLERTRCIGAKWGTMNEFKLWDHFEGECEILAVSEISWEHCIEMVKIERRKEEIDLMEQDNSPVDDPSEVKEVA